jgi:hypothetical protein
VTIDIGDGNEVIVSVPKSVKSIVGHKVFLNFSETSIHFFAKGSGEKVVTKTR